MTIYHIKQTLSNTAFSIVEQTATKLLSIFFLSHLISNEVVQIQHANSISFIILI